MRTFPYFIAKVKENTESVQKKSETDVKENKYADLKTKQNS